MTIGTNGNDTYTNVADNFAYLLDGNDYIYFAATLSSAFVEGGRGNDTIFGTGRFDSIYGGQGDDYLSVFLQTGDALGSYFDGGRGNDSIYAAGGADTIMGGSENDVIFSSDGNDLVYAGTGNDSIDGGVGGDSLYGEFGLDTISGGEGVDVIDGGDQNDMLYGGIGNDFLSGDGGDDYVSGDQGLDTLFGKDGNDTMLGGAGADSMYGGAGNDVYEVTDLGDVVAEEGTNFGAGGFDTVYSTVNFGLGAGIDNLILVGSAEYGFGSDADNLLFGNDFSNHLEGGVGYDVVTGGGGADRFVSRGNFGTDVVTDFSTTSGDTVFLQAGRFASGFASVLAQSKQVGFDTWVGDGFGNTLVLQNVDRAQLSANDFSFF
jgi:Ca2+-binding RTX toxin-like protein